MPLSRPDTLGIGIAERIRLPVRAPSAKSTASLCHPTSEVEKLGRYHGDMARAATAVLKSASSRLVRWTLAFTGVLCVCIGAVGVFVPGLPTTVFLIIATWCFAKSCPWLEERLIRNRLFAPVLAYVDRTQPIPARTKATAIAAMWLCVAISVSVLISRDASPIWTIAVIGGAACIGTWCILRWDAGLRRQDENHPSDA